MITNDQKNELREILEDSTEAHLADCLDMVPEANLDAIYRMVQDMRSRNVQRAIKRFNVIQDVAALVGGTHGSIPLLSDPYLRV